MGQSVISEKVISDWAIREFVINGSLQITRSPDSLINHLPNYQSTDWPITNYPITNYQLPITNYQLPN
jgi:hypothetical protein